MQERNLQLWERYKQGDLRAKEQLILDNQKLVHQCRHDNFPFLRPEAAFDIEDLEMAGFTGLTEAVDLYDPARGAFSTLAYLRIYKEMSRAIENEKKLVRVPVHQYSNIRAYFRLLHQGITDDKEIAKQLKLKPAQYAVLQTAIGFATGVLLEEIQDFRTNKESLDERDNGDLVFRAFNELQLADQWRIDQRFDLQWVKVPATFEKDLSSTQQRKKLSQSMTKLRKQIRQIQEKGL